MIPLLTIALPDLAGPAALARTLASLARHTPGPHEVVLWREPGSAALPLPEGVARTLTVPAPFAAPAALNRLLAESESPFLLLLESGCVVTAGWLQRLLAPFDDSTVGLTGPSTNLSWNEQQVVPHGRGGGWSEMQIERFAATHAARHGERCEPLDTLHSLGDFCYLFRREVAVALGGFDEAYGVGPCWEIDFNTRAARVGVRALWVVGAYVHRAPTPASRVQLTRRLFERNKQLYQDRFCGLRLRGEKHDYEPHCRGEACEHFAPRELIQIALPTPPASSVRAESPHSDSPRAARDPKRSSSSHSPHAGGKHTSPPPQEPTRSIVPTLQRSNVSPLVSCIMPTADRRTFVPQALHYFARQDYPNRELIVVDDGSDPVADLMPADPRVRYLRLERRLTIGEKRNLACEQARGEIIAHWDDDDWYAPHRLSHQVAPLLAGGADVTGLETGCFFDLQRWEGWRCTPALHQRLFVGDVHGGTLVFWRQLWQRSARYPARSLAEDALFLRELQRRGARLRRLPHAESFIYLRHGSNAWRFPLGSYLDPAGWQRVEPTQWLAPEEQRFYASLSPAAPWKPPDASAPAPAVQRSSVSPRPLVSCIMPTADRPAFVPQAIAYFLRQDYAPRELIILDDGERPVGALVPDDPRLRYVRLEKKLILGAKRNLACQMARGELIAHWDDDDWMAPHRLSYQVSALEQQRADLCGAARQLYYDPRADQAWLYEYPSQLRRWVAGNTLCYRKAFWAAHRFPEVAEGEDTRFVWSARTARAAILPDTRFYVGLVHAANTSPKRVTGPYWRPHAVAEVHELLGADLSFYRQLEQLERDGEEAGVVTRA